MTVDELRGIEIDLDREEFEERRLQTKRKSSEE